MACWNFNGHKRSKYGSENEQRELLQDIKRASFVVAHNAKFELQWLKRCGLDLRTVVVYDTMLAEWILLGNQRDTGLSLEASTSRRGLAGKLNTVSQLIKLGVDPENIPRNWLLEYCHVDVDITEQLFLKQRQLLKERNLLHLQYQRGLVCACLSDIEFNGLKLDKDRVYDEYNKVLAEHAATEKELFSFAEINWRSSKQVSELLYGTLGFDLPKDVRGNEILKANGTGATNKEAISRLKPKTKKQVRFIELYKKIRLLEARLSKSLNFFKGVCEQYDGIFYGILNQGRTATHRLSSSGRPVALSKREDDGSISIEYTGAQFQNIPREYKRLFRAVRQDWLILEADEGQLEFRGAADLCKDKIALKEIENDVDVHEITAKTLTEAGEPTDRQTAKGFTFKPLFGGGAGTPAVVEYCKFFKQKYSGIAATQKDWTYEVLRTHKLVTPYGMIFYWPNTKMSRSGYIDNTTSISNYPIQGFSTGEIVPIALLCFWHRIKDKPALLVNTIHDSVIAEVHPEHVKEITEIARVALIDDVKEVLHTLYNYQLTVPLMCEIKVGEYWGEDKGTKYKSNGNQERS